LIFHKIFIFLDNDMLKKLLVSYICIRNDYFYCYEQDKLLLIDFPFGFITFFTVAKKGGRRPTTGTFIGYG